MATKPIASKSASKVCPLDAGRLLAILLAVGVLQFGCASAPLMSLEPAPTDDLSVVDLSGLGEDGPAFALISMTENTVVTLAPLSAQFKSGEDLWFNVVATNLSDLPLAFSLEDISVNINGSPKEMLLSADELEDRIEAYNRRARNFALGMAALHLVSARDDLIGAWNQYQTFEGLLSQDTEVTHARLEQFRDTALRPAVMPAVVEGGVEAQDHGGMFLIGPGSLLAEEFDRVNIGVRVGTDRHHFSFFFRPLAK